jgi:hypothetical protein
MDFKRKIYDRILDWKKKYSGKYALLIKGARRVGKTTVVEKFAKNEYKTFILIDFSKIDSDVEEIFTHNAGNLDKIFLFLQDAYNTILYNRESLIIFDEVQLFPFARQMIKHFVADGRYDYIETGSLLSIKQNVENILIPSEEMSIEMHPMDFEEFLWAQNNEVTVHIIRDAFKNRVPLGNILHKQIMDRYVLYMLIGGMPQAVEAYIENNNFESVENVKQTILNLYSDDTSKIKTDRGLKSKRIFEQIPSFLSKHEKTFSPSMMREGTKTREYYDSVTWLGESRMVNICYRNSDPSPALDLNLDENSFKIYMVDTGLLITASFRSNTGNREEVYKNLLKNKMAVNKGMFFENMVAQELTATGHKLRFCKFYIEGSTNIQEVDFIIADSKKITPIESKSGVSGKHASLDRFMNKFSSRVGEGYVIHSKDLKVDGNIVYLPIYMTMFL